MKKDKLSLNSWISEAEASGKSMQEFLIEYNAKELECSKEELLAKMEAMLVVSFLFRDGYICRYI